jgi:cell division protein FtsB
MQNYFTPETIHLAKRYLLVAACSLALLSIGAYEIFGQSGYLARRRRRIEIQTLTTEIQKLKQENTGLARQIKDLRSDPDTIEKLARERLRLGRPGDVVVTLAPPQPAEPAAAPSDKK